MVLAKKVAIVKALEKLNDALNSYKYSLEVTSIPADYKKMFVDVEELQISLRDSLIQRFEFCVDLVWKYAKEYLENVEQVTLEVKTPRGTIRALCAARLISEPETEQALEMIKHRNMTSHIYHEEVAQIISKQIPVYYTLMMHIVQAIDRQCENKK